MPRTHCPVLGCAKWSNRWVGKSYPLPPTHEFTLQLDPQLAVPRNDRICQACYRRSINLTMPLQGRVRVVPPFPSSSSSSSSSADGILQLLMASEINPPSHSVEPLPLLSNHILPLQSTRPVLPDITNTVSTVKQRRHSTPLKRKRELVEEAQALQTPEQRREFYKRKRVDRQTLSRYDKIVRENEARPVKGRPPAEGEPPAKRRRPMTGKRMSGAGRKTALATEQEQWLRDWILSLRRCEHHFAVAEIHIQLAARAKFNIKAGNKWVQGFLKRQGLSLRLKTTRLEVTAPYLQSIGFHWRNKFANTFAIKHHDVLFNMDETSMYLDAPGNRTVDEIGTRIVEIGTTLHDRKRVGVLLCVNRAGDMVTPLIVHHCYEKKKFVKMHQFFEKTVKTSDGKPFVICVTYAPKGWLNTVIMGKWLQEMYVPYVQSTKRDISDAILFMDGCSPHRTDEIVAILQQSNIRYELFPPNCTPILQPLDQVVNREFKREYEKEWEKWYKETGCFGRTRYGNRKKATEEEVNVWVASAASRITAHMVRMSWERSTCTPPHLMHLPLIPWKRVLSFLPTTQQICLTPLLNRHRTYYDGSRFQFPVAKKRRRKRGGEVKSDEKEMEDDEEDEEGEGGPLEIIGQVPLTDLYHMVPPPPGQPTGRLRLHPSALLFVR